MEGGRSLQSTNIYDYIDHKEGKRLVESYQLKSRGEPIAVEDSRWLISSQLAIVAARDDFNQKIWWALVTHKIQAELPKGLSFTGADGNVAFANDITMGKVTITVKHDEAFQATIGVSDRPTAATTSTATSSGPPPKTNVLLKVPVVSCEDWGPQFNSESKSISNSVSQDVGVNIGVFGSTPTAGASKSYSMSNSVSETIQDITLTTSLSNKATCQSWLFDFSKMNSSASHSTFNHTVQAIWRIADPDTEDPSRQVDSLGNFALAISFEWEPQVKTQIGRSAFQPQRFADKVSDTWNLQWTGGDGVDSVIPQTVK